LKFKDIKNNSVNQWFQHFKFNSNKLKYHELNHKNNYLHKQTNDFNSGNCESKWRIKINWNSIRMQIEIDAIGFYCFLLFGVVGMLIDLNLNNATKRRRREAFFPLPSRKFCGVGWIRMDAIRIRVFCGRASN